MYNYHFKNDIMSTLFLSNQTMTTGNLKRKPDDQHSNSNSDWELNHEINKKLKTVSSKQYLLAFQLVTCGFQNNDLGRDETATLQLGFQLIDVAGVRSVGGKIILLQASSLLDPSANPDKIHISIPAREMTELLTSPNSYSNKNLQEAINEIDVFISENIQNTEDQLVEVVPVIVGHLPLRSVLHRETRFRNINLNSYWYHYYNLCDEVSKFLDYPVQNLEEISIGLHIDRHKMTTGSAIWTMTAATLHLLQCGYSFQMKHFIKCSYKPAIFHADDEIEPDVVIMIKPIDYRTPISQIIPFFRGLNIANGGIAVVMSDGRRSNKILVKFEDKIQRDIALLRDKHHIEPGNSRFITISVFNSREFMKIAGYENENVKVYLEKVQDEEQILVRIKGLPYTVTKSDILNFFKSNNVEVQFSYDGIFLVQKLSGDLNGDAFIIFKNEETAEKAKNLKGMTIGNRYMEIFYSTPAEMNQVIAAVNKVSIKPKPTKFSSKGVEAKILDSPQNSAISDTLISGTITKSIPAEATDNDFFKYLAEYRELCLKVFRSNLYSPIGYVSYISIFKSLSDAEMVMSVLRHKPFKIELTNKEVIVETIEFPLSNKLNNKLATSPQILPNTYLNNLPFSYSSSVPNILPYSPLQYSQPLNFQNSLAMTAINGSLLNYGLIPNFFYGNQSINPVPEPNLLMMNQVPISVNIPTSPSIKIFTGKDILNNSISTNHFWSNYRQLIPFSFHTRTTTNKSKVLLMSGILSRLIQTDLDNMFHSIASNISMMPKLLQHNQFSYAVFHSVEDANIALQRCPIIIYNSQVIQLIPATD